MSPAKRYAISFFGLAIHSAIFGLTLSSAVAFVLGSIVGTVLTCMSLEEEVSR